MRKTLPILAIFILSGSAGLVYEVVWARQLVLVFGNTAQAISAILTGFFGGMAIGSVVGGRIGDRVRSPLRLFGFLELALAAVVLATPFLFRQIHEVYRGAYGALEGNPALLTIVRFLLALIALAPATVFMGATLPALTRHLTRNPRHLGIAFGKLYAANTVGAAIGAGLAGFVLIEIYGLAGALIWGAVGSVLAGVIALWLDRTGSNDIVNTEASSPGTEASPHAGIPDDTRRIRLALAIAFASGFTALGYQVVWVRLLASGTGNSTYVFTAILTMFLFGLGLGAVAFNWYRRRIADHVNFLAHGQLMIALLVSVGMVTAVSRQITGFIPAGEAFLPLFLEFLAVVAVVVLPATFVMGLTFPAAASLAADPTGRVARNSGLVLAANTLGAITATIAIPFLVIPAVGSPAAAGVLSITNIAVALGLAGWGGIRETLPRRVVFVVGTVASIAIAGGLQRQIGFRDPTVAWIEKSGGRVLESREDAIASVQAGELNGPQLWVTGVPMTALTIDAKLMPLVPLMLRPDAESLLSVAFGMGSSHRTALIAGLRADVVELVPSVIPMFHWFFDDAGDVLRNPRGRVVITDGRNYVELTTRTYDIIITDPPPPIESAGVSVIASKQYYEASARRLNPGGVVMQWIPYGSTLFEFKAHVRTFDSVFGNVMVAVSPAGSGFLLMGSSEPIRLEKHNIDAVLARPGVISDLSSALDSPDGDADEWSRRILEMVWMEGPEVRQFTGDGPIVTDNHPMPEYFLLRHLSQGGRRMMPSDVIRR